ncbi:MULTISPECIES: HlyD family secretion protein [unclassified Janthinobacterium]|uniref:HlyD family secretion protein n=1 Tax=unclassified Janthinobacterium TaxID=2610881 RepID=UPI001E4A3989|nr:MULTISPECIES: HlyD family secretion protein [unclassified Janthinobacterium]MCC7643964.1 efflux RND transporter periplasmic adaptor subunit [Janthinobacterium sp. EB271-G4-3-1]MCC7692057.1 efflux RND transporter periplasmic adaptor subunit [Janthinobacterium sp. EB271-G4-3-2]
MSTSKKPLAIVAAVIVLAFVGWGLYQALQSQRLPLQGQMDAQEVNVSSKVPGRVGELYVKLGQTVPKGELLFQLTSPEVDAKIAQATAATQAADAVAQKAQAGARPEEVAAAKANWERALTGATIAKTTYTRVNNMFEQGVIAQQKRDEAQAQWRAADQLAQAARAQYDMAQKGARPEDKTAAAAQARQVGAVLTEAQIALAETKIAAPVAGQVSKIQIQPGELAPQGFPVITLVNLDDAWAVLQVREDEMAAFAMGSTHTANVPALKQQLSFKVSSVAVLPDFATWRAARPGGTDLRTFEIRLRPAIKVEGLRPGMSVVFPPL